MAWRKRITSNASILLTTRSYREEGTSQVLYAVFGVSGPKYRSRKEDKLRENKTKGYRQLHGKDRLEQKQRPGGKARKSRND